MRSLLWIGDAACDSGFARCTEKTIPALIKAGWKVSVLGINYRGDPHPFRRYLEGEGGNLYPAYVIGGPRDLLGVARVLHVVAREKPDLVVLQNDPWNIPRYVAEFAKLKRPPVLVGAVAVDGMNCRGKDLNGLDHAIFWTQFGRNEAVSGGYTGTTGVVPLGVDLDVYKPLDRVTAREAVGIPSPAREGFIVLNVNRNQPRKRIDLTIRYFAEFYHVCKAHDAYLYLHVCPTGDVGVDPDQLAAYYGLKGRVLLEQPGVYEGLSEADLALTYQASDVQMTTTQGEGWGLTTMEGMACGVPQVLPKWSALGEWARTAAVMVPCTGTAATLGGVNAIGGIADETAVVKALESLYHSSSVRADLVRRGLALVQDSQFRWENIGARFAEEVERAFQATLGGARYALGPNERREGDASQVGEATRTHS